MSNLEMTPFPKCQPPTEIKEAIVSVDVVDVEAALPQLSPGDLAMFGRLGIPPELLLEARVQRVSNAEAHLLLGIIGSPSKDLSGIAFPYFNPVNNYRITARVRRDNPEIEAGKEKNKYISAYGDRRHLYFPPRSARKRDDVQAPIVLVESEKASLALTAWAERVGMSLLPLGLGGCWGWRGRIGKTENARGVRVDEVGPIASMHYCDGRKVFVLLDANVATNSKVRQAQTALVAELRKRRCDVLLCSLPIVEGVNGPDDYIGMCGDKAMAEVFAGARGNDASALEAWLEPEPLGSELPPVPAFDPELLPDALRPWCEDVAMRMQVPLDFPAAAAIGALGAACMRRVMIQPKHLDTGWVIVPIVWGGLIGEPGTKKTPTLSAIFQPLHKIQASWKAMYEAAAAEAVIEAEKQELRLQAYRLAYRRYCTSKGNADEPSRPTAAAGVDLRKKQLICNDATYEALSEMLAGNPAGVSILRDELPAWLQTFERQGREADRAFFLECWAGHLPFSSSRISRGVTDVAHCAVGVFGGIQPNRLHSYLRDVQQDDGLFQRFQVLVFPDYPQDTGYVDAMPDEPAQREATAVFERIAAMNAKNPVILQFAPDAQKLFEEWLPQLDTRVFNEDLPPAYRAHLAKYRSLMPTIALLLSLADGCLEAVSMRHARMAAAWCEYLEQHARRIYASQITPEMAAAQALSHKLTAGWRAAEGWFTLRDVYRPQWAGLTSPNEARAALHVLCQYGWVRKAQQRDATGRPSETYEIDPRITEMN